MRPAGLQEPLHHWDFAIALRIRSRGHSGNGPDGAHDAGAGPNGIADWFGDEGIRSEDSHDAPGRSTRRDPRDSAWEAHAASSFVEGGGAAQDVGEARGCASYCSRV